MRIAHTMPDALLVGRSESFGQMLASPSDEDHAMKTLLCAVCFLGCLSTTAAFSQSAAVLSSNPQPMQMAEHSEHASQHAMAQETTLLDTSAYAYAKGEVPLSELGSIPREIPLGDVARALRKQRAMKGAPKAVRVFEK
jgi:hypothetical protein